MPEFFISSEEVHEATSHSGCILADPERGFAGRQFIVFPTSMIEAAKGLPRDLAAISLETSAASV